MQDSLFDEQEIIQVKPFKTQLLKWVGNKQRFAHEIASHFPSTFGTYFEPFLGSGAVLATLRPSNAIASDVFGPLTEIWTTLKENPNELVAWYSDRWLAMMSGDKVPEYERIKASYNQRPNGADLVFLCRSCYGGVVRFRKTDGYMSTPCGVHSPITPDSFSKRVYEWHERIAGTKFLQSDYRIVFDMAREGDLIYCDPPYSSSQSILYGAQSFSLQQLFADIAQCKTKGVKVALSIDGTKRSGNTLCNVKIPEELFATEKLVNCGQSMLKRFQMSGMALTEEAVTDRLLLTY